jgi:2-hydroxy-6-oxonona-2,4-dienedioate hydrolase
MQTRASASLERLKSRWVFLDGKLIHTLVPSTPVPVDNPPAVILPGFVVSSRYAEPAAERLAPFIQTYVPDLPGFGRSERPRHVPDLPVIASYLEAWVDTMGLDRIALIGGSFGAQIAVEFALRYPQRVERMILVGPTLEPEARDPFHVIWRWLINASHEPPVPKALIEDYLRAHPRWIFRLAQYALRDRIEDKLPRIQTPTLIINGALDSISPVKWAEQLVNLLPNGRLEIIPDASHSILQFWPKEFARIAVPFLTERYPLDR